MNDYSLNFNLQPLDQLDNFALIACQDYNLGNKGDWFGPFRGGIYAVSHRIYAICQHFYQVHAWVSSPRLLGDAEYHLSSIFFNMDSALECYTFGLNALGNAIESTIFRDVNDVKELRSVSPSDIYGGKRPALPGYGKYFPELKRMWESEQPLMDEIRDQHDVSKHRQTIFVGGSTRTDAPNGFFEAMGVKENSVGRGLFQPMAQIILKRDPKLPWGTQKPQPFEESRFLEDLTSDFVSLFNQSTELALADARETIKLNYNELRKNTSATGAP
jgi:hypothetical protein